MNEDVSQMDENELKRVCAFALCPPGQATASNFCNTLDGVIRQVQNWCDRHDALLLMERTPRRDEDGTKDKWFVRVRLDPRVVYGVMDHGDNGPDLRIVLMRASLSAARAVEEKIK